MLRQDRSIMEGISGSHKPGQRHQASHRRIIIASMHDGGPSRSPLTIYHESGSYNMRLLVYSLEAGGTTLSLGRLGCYFTTRYAVVD